MSVFNTREWDPLDTEKGALPHIKCVRLLSQFHLNFILEPLQQDLVYLGKYLIYLGKYHVGSREGQESGEFMQGLPRTICSFALAPSVLASAHEERRNARNVKRVHLRS